MSDNRLENLRIGSKIVEGGRVYKVFKIKKKKVEGKNERILYYRPYFKNTINNGLICSIPEKSLKDTNLRRPVSKNLINETLQGLSKRVRLTEPLDAVKAKETLKLNNFKKSTRVLKKFWTERKRGGTLTKTKKDVINMALDKIAEEIAFIKGTSVDKAKEKITEALNA